MAYAVDETNLERQRLLAQVFEPMTWRLLDRVDLTGGRCLNVGCGLGYETHLLADVLPPPAHVIGLDIDPALIEAAQANDASADHLDVQYQEGDAQNLPFEDDEFDVIFARNLLCHLPNPMAALEECRRVCRAGGLVMAQEPDFSTLGTHPPYPAYVRAKELADFLFDTQFGRKEWHQFGQAGFQNVQVDADIPVEAGEGNVMRRCFRLSIEAIGEALTAKGVIDRSDFDKMMADIRQCEEDPDTLIVGYALYSVWAEP